MSPEIDQLQKRVMDLYKLLEVSDTAQTKLWKEHLALQETFGRLIDSHNQLQKMVIQLQEKMLEDSHG